MKDLDETIILNLTQEERRLLLDNTVLPLTIAATIKRARQRRGSYACAFTPEELVHIGDAIGEAFPRLKKPAERKGLDRLWDQIGAILKAYAEEDPKEKEAPTWPSQMPAELQEELNGVIQCGKYTSFDELNAGIAVVMKRFNQTGQEEMGGLSPEQVGRLLNTPWDSPNSPIQINDNLTLNELLHVHLLTNARLLLSKVSEGIKATAKGNLNRKFVETMLHEMDLPDGYVEEVRRYNKVINEDDFWPLHLTRILLDLGRLIRRTKGNFRITKKGQELLASEKAGKLYALLFHTHFGKFNLSYLDGLPEDLPIQETIAYSLYQVSKLFGKWQTPEKALDILLLPTVREHINAYGYTDYPRFACSARILRPLEKFGLLERRELSSKEKWDKPYQVRKTELFDRFLGFEV